MAAEVEHPKITKERSSGDTFFDADLSSSLSSLNGKIHVWSYLPGTEEDIIIDQDNNQIKEYKDYDEIKEHKLKVCPKVIPIALHHATSILASFNAQKSSLNCFPLHY